MDSSTLIVGIDECRPNPWNYNTETAATFGKVVESIRRFGFSEPLVVRQVRDVPGYEIINGEHRWRAGKELLLERVAVTNVGYVTDERAKELCIVLNELGGRPDEVRLAELLRDISKSGVSEEELRGVMPFASVEMKSLLASVDFSFAHLSARDSRTDVEPRESDGEQTLPTVPPGEVPPVVPAAPLMQLSFRTDKATIERLALVAPQPEGALLALLDAWEKDNAQDHAKA